VVPLKAKPRRHPTCNHKLRRTDFREGLHGRTGDTLERPRVHLSQAEPLLSGLPVQREQLRLAELLVVDSRPLSESRPLAQREQPQLGLVRDSLQVQVLAELVPPRPETVWEHLSEVQNHSPSKTCSGPDFLCCTLRT
jgi:hypothetical protein